MTDLVYDYISTGVDMILMAAILSSIVVLLRSSVVLSSYQANLQANSDRMNYYKQYNMYDCTDTLCAADVLSALVYYRYDLKMVVVNQTDGSIIVYNDPGTGKFYLGDNSEVTVSTLNTILLADRTFDSWLCENGSDEPSTSTYTGGLVTGLKFSMHPVSP